AGDAGAVRRPARRAPPYAGGPAPPLPGRGPSGLPDRPAGPADHRAHRIGKPDTVRHRADRPRSRRRMAHRAATFPARAGHRPHLAAHAPLRLPRPGGGEMTEAAVPGARRGGASVPSVGVVIVTRGRRPRLLRAAVRAVLTQEHPGDLELVIVVDHDPRDTPGDAVARVTAQLAPVLASPPGRPRPRILSNRRTPG